MKNICIFYLKSKASFLLPAQKRFHKNLFLKSAHFGKSFSIGTSRMDPLLNDSNADDNLTEDELKEKQNMKAMYDYLLGREVYTWKDYLQQLIASHQKGKGLLQRFREKEDKEKTEVTNLNRFVSCLFEDEINKTNFTDQEVKDISSITDMPDQYIKIQIIKNFMYYKGLHTWLKNKQSKGQKLPDSSEQLYEELNQESPQFMKDLNEISLKEVKKKLGYAEDYIQENERKLHYERVKRRRPTWKF